MNTSELWYLTGGFSNYSGGNLITNRRLIKFSRRLAHVLPAEMLPTTLKSEISIEENDNYLCCLEFIRKF
jgi:hypothetical protein